MQQHGFSIVEILIAFAITALLSSVGLSSLINFIHLQNANLAIHQLQLAINYARSLAISQQKNVTVCPSYNRYSCGGGWQHGILVTTNDGITRFFNSYLQTNAIIYLSQYGNSNDRVQIHGDGMTNSNGHFVIKLLKPGYIPQFNLYFNKALRLYVSETDYKNDKKYW